MSSTPIAQFILFGPVPSKKNMYKKRHGPGKGMYIPKEVQALLDNLRLQIPFDVKDAKLLHPDIEIEYFLPTDINKQHTPWESDPDGRFTTLLDVFVKAGVLENDSFKTCNGCKLLHPAKLSAQDGRSIDETQITLYENGGLMKSLRERQL